MSQNTRHLVFIPALAVIMGILGACTAFALMRLIAIISNLVFFQKLSTALPLTLVHNSLGAGIIVVPIIGAILIGIMARYGSDKICGHGIPEAMEAVWQKKSRISPKVAILKPLSAAIAIGTGGPFGAEGPIIQTGSALGSILGQFLKVSPSERKVLLACGAVAGMAGIFGTPLAAVFFALELLVFEFKATTIISLTLAAATSNILRGTVMGFSPMFVIGKIDFGNIHILPAYVLLGIICGITAVSFNRSFYFIESLFDKVPWNPFGRLILGAIGLGIIGYLYPVVLGVGYHSITDLLNMRLAIHVVIILLIIKSIALLVSLGSGTSGGLLAPMFTMGAALGSLLALMLAHIWPEFAGYEGAMALAGMGALFAASSRSTFAFILFSFEITQNYSSILPLMITTTFASIIAWLFSKHSIMTERLAQRGLTLHHVYEVDIFRRITVGEAMTNHISLINQHTPIVELKHCLEPGEPAQAIVNDEGKLIGILTPANIAQGLLDPASVNKTCGELAKQVPITHPDEIIQVLLERTHKKNIDVYPVMSKTHPPKLLGWINRERMLEAKIQFEKTENEVEPAMLFRFNEKP